MNRMARGNHLENDIRRVSLLYRREFITEVEDLASGGERAADENSK